MYNMVSHQEKRLVNSAPAVIEGDRNYFVILKMPDVARADIVVDLHDKAREMVVAATRHSALNDKINYWVFALPEDADIDWTTMRLQNGTLEIVMPRLRHQGVA